MIDAFWSGVGEELARTWVARVLTPAFAFWVGGAVLVWWHVNAAEVAALGWLPAVVASAAGLGALPVLVQGALVVGGLVLVVTSAVVAERLTLPVLRLMEGYWTGPAWWYGLLTGYRRWRRRRVYDRALRLERRRMRGTLDLEEVRELAALRAKAEPDRVRLAELEKKESDFTPWQNTRLGRDEAWLRTTPERDALGMPTRLGDILRAAEHRPAASYGIDAVVCWDALWQLLPAEVRTGLTTARTGLDSAVRGWLWGALFLVWTPWSWWALVVGVGVPLLSYRFGILPRALTFGELINVGYDLYRTALYDTLRLPRPTSPTDERTVAGPRLTAALAGTLVEEGLSYRVDMPPAEGRASG